MLVITSNYPEQMPDGSVSGAKVMLDGIDDHAGWHILFDITQRIFRQTSKRGYDTLRKDDLSTIKTTKSIKRKVC